MLSIFGFKLPPCSSYPLLYSLFFQFLLFVQQLPAPPIRPRLDPHRHLIQRIVVGLLGVAGERCCLIGPVLTLVQPRALGQCSFGRLIGRRQTRIDERRKFNERVHGVLTLIVIVVALVGAGGGPAGSSSMTAQKYAALLSALAL